MESKVLTGVCGLHSEGELSGYKTDPWTPLALTLVSFSHRLLNQTIFQPALEKLNYSLVENYLFTTLVIGRWIENLLGINISYETVFSIILLSIILLSSR